MCQYDTFQHAGAIIFLLLLQYLPFCVEKPVQKYRDCFIKFCFTQPSYTVFINNLLMLTPLNTDLSTINSHKAKVRKHRQQKCR